MRALSLTNEIANDCFLDLKEAWAPLKHDRARRLTHAAECLKRDNRAPTMAATNTSSERMTLTSTEPSIKTEVDQYIEAEEEGFFLLPDVVRPEALEDGEEYDMLLDF